MKRAEIIHTHADRIARQLERAALNDDAAKIAPLIASIAKRHGCSVATIARIAVAHVGAA